MNSHTGPPSLVGWSALGAQHRALMIERDCCRATDQRRRARQELLQVA